MRNPTWRFIPLGIASLCLLISCARPASGPRLDPEAEQVDRLRQMGDAEFAKMHWRGWRNAAAHFQEALSRRDGTALRQRLFMACVLLSLRESELAFRDESWLRQAEELLPRLPAAPYASYLALANEKTRTIQLNRAGYTGHGAPELEKNPVAKDSSTLMSHYLYLIYLGFRAGRDGGREFIEEGTQFCRLHGDSNLAVYQRIWTPEEMDDRLDAFPDFAEMYMQRGDWHHSGKKYQAALADYGRALEAMPVLSEASNAMGTLWYSLEEYDRARIHYERTLLIDPLDPAAMFGRAICLSELRRYEESDLALGEMITRQSFYHGEANYYLAKNSYYRRRRDDARSYLDRAAAFIPDAPEMNMLSGLLFLDQGQAGRAESEFRKVLEQRPSDAEAWYFMGQVALQRGMTREARRRYQKAVDGFRRELDLFDARLAEVGREGVSDPHGREYYRKRLRRRSAYAREESERLTPLLRELGKPPLAGLRQLLADLAAPPREQPAFKGSSSSSR